MLNKKAYMITPLLFVVFIIIAGAFAFYTFRIDSKVSEGIQISATIEKGINGIYKEQITKETFVKMAAYNCSRTYCCNSSNNWEIKVCIENFLNNTYENNTWNVGVDCPNLVNFDLTPQRYNATNINIELGISTVEVNINTMFLNTTC